jgi:hypothetical protein
MSKVVTTTVLPDVAGGSVTLGGTGDSVVVTGNDIRTNALQDAGGNAVFTSNGSGTMSGMNSAFGGALNLIQSQTASNAANVSFTSGLDSTYDVYIFKFINIHHDAGTQTHFSFQVNSSGQTGFNEVMTTTFFRADHSEADATTFGYHTTRDQTAGTSYQALFNEGNTDADASISGELHLFAPASTTYVKHFYSETQGYKYGAGTAQHAFAAGYINTTAAITEIDFKDSGGNNFDGIIKLYGISKS